MLVTLVIDENNHWPSRSLIMKQFTKPCLSSQMKKLRDLFLQRSELVLSDLLPQDWFERLDALSVSLITNDR